MDDPIPDWMPPAWERYLREHRYDEQPADDIHRDLFDSDLMALQRTAELSKAIALLRSSLGRPLQVFMEIGADRNTTLYHWLRAFPALRKMIAVEIRGTPFAASFEAAFPAVQFLWLGESSYTPECVAKVEQFLGGDRIDALFIDGDKSHFDTDFDLYEPLVASGGFILMHDVFDNNSPMQEAYLSRSLAYQKRGVIIDTSECDVAKAAMLAGYPPRNSYDQWMRTWCHTSCGFGYVIKD